MRLTRWTALVVMSACGAASPPAAPRVRPTVDAQLAVGGDLGVLAIEGTEYVFGRDQVVVMRGGRPGSHGTPPRVAGAARWDAIASITGPDGERWAVGLAAGALWRVRADGAVEAAGDRLGIGDARVLSIASSPTTYVIGLVGGVAISRDGAHVLRFAGDDARVVAATESQIAIGTASGVELYDLARGTSVRYPVGAPTTLDFVVGDAVAVDATQPRLVVAVGGAVYVEQRGTLVPVPAPGSLRSLAASGTRVWMLAASGLYAWDASGLVRITADTSVTSQIFAAEGGGVWLGSGAHWTRLSLAPAAVGWDSVVAPIFAASCASCHLPGGTADLDLSGVAAWTRRPAEIRHVLETRTMPPPGTNISDADRARLVAWLRGR